MPHPSLRKSPILHMTACLVLTAGLAGCKDEGVSTLFDEDGTWSLISFDKIGGSTFTELNENRENGFLFRFNSGAGKVAVASCQDQQEHDNGEPGDVTATLCAQAMRPQFWYCQCFFYAFEESEMCWKHESAGGLPPEIDTCGMGSGGVDGGTGGTGGGGVGGPNGEWKINVSEDVDAASTYLFTPLPQMFMGEPAIFGSGPGSRYRMQQKADTLFDETACAAECGV